MNNEQHQQETTERPVGPALYLVEVTSIGDNIDHGWSRLGGGWEGFSDYAEIGAIFHGVKPGNYIQIADQEGFGSLNFAEYAIQWSMRDTQYDTDCELSTLADIAHAYGDSLEVVASLYSWSSGFDHVNDWTDVANEISERLRAQLDRQEQPIEEWAEKEWEHGGELPGLEGVPDEIIQMLDWGRYARNHLTHLYHDGLFLWYTD